MFKALLGRLPPKSVQLHQLSLQIQCYSNFIPRRVFPEHNVVLAQFHGHHRQALQKLSNLAQMTEFVVELRDSRAPISTMNPLLRDLLGHVPKIVLYTKCDRSRLSLEDMDKWPRLEESYRIDSRSHKDVRKILNIIKAKLSPQEGEPHPPLGYRLLVTGMPNVGKSTFLNTLRSVGMNDDLSRDSGGTKNRNIARTGDMPGVTKKVGSMARICSSPNILVHDTPGVMMPRAESSERMLKLCLVNAVNPSNVVDWEVLADYLLFQLNRNKPKNQGYPGPLTNDIDEVLLELYRSKQHKKGTNFNPTAIAEAWVQKYLRNKAGPRLLLDDVSPESYKEAFCRRIDSKPLWHQPNNQRQLRNLLQ